MSDMDEDAKIQLLKAIENGELETLKKYLESESADINFLMTDGNGKEQTPLIMAARKGRLDIARYLAEIGVQVDGTTAAGWTAIHVAAQVGHLDDKPVSQGLSIVPTRWVRLLAGSLHQLCPPNASM